MTFHDRSLIDFTSNDTTHPADEWRPATLLELWALWVTPVAIIGAVAAALVWGIPKI